MSRGNMSIRTQAFAICGPRSLSISTILKQANSVKDMLAVTEHLSEVRGQIEQQQAEFNALSRQIETVALTDFSHD